MKVVSNTSPITHLAAIGRLELLRDLYAQVLIPEAVFTELTGDLSNPGAAEVQEADWIPVVALREDRWVRALAADLHRGEAAAIALAIQEDADLLLLDERMARRVAQRMGMPRMGILGVLLEAKRRTLLPEVRPVLDELLADGFWLTRRVYEEVLALAEER